MRATFNGQPGELTIEHCTTLRYMENGKVRKFYQQMLVQFVPGSGGIGNPVSTFWSLSNWGPGSEAQWGNSDLKGGIKSESQPSSYMAEQANTRQVQHKQGGGYQFYTEFKAAANVTPPPKLLAELGVRTHALLRDTEPPTPETNRRWQSLELMQSSITDVSAAAMDLLINGNLPEAIRLRQDLIEMSAQIRTLHESTQGQLEMLTLKLAAELKK
jgi:hypothetical protein